MHDNSTKSGRGRSRLDALMGYTALIAATALLGLLAFGAFLGITGLIRTVWRGIFGE